MRHVAPQGATHAAFTPSATGPRDARRRPRCPDDVPHRRCCRAAVCNRWRGCCAGSSSSWRTVAVALPLGFILSSERAQCAFLRLLTARSASPGFEFIFSDPDFWSALKNSFVIASGMLFISIPLGGILRVPDGSHRPARPPLARSRCCSRLSSFRCDGARVLAMSSRPVRSALFGLVEENAVRQRRRRRGPCTRFLRSR